MATTDRNRVDLLLRVLRLSRHPEAAETLAATLGMLERDFPTIPDADVRTERAVEFAFRVRLHETAPDTWASFVLDTQTEAERILTQWDDQYERVNVGPRNAVGADNRGVASVERPAGAAFSAGAPLLR